MAGLFKPKIKFYSENEIITDKYPIYPAGEYKRKWVKNCSKAYTTHREVVDNRHSVITAAKCPGMRTVMEMGYIVSTWCDFTIETVESKPYEYKIFYPDNLNRFLKDSKYDKPIITDFNLKNSPLKIPTGNSLKNILKVWSPWTIEVPQGWNLMFMPVQYDDNLAFTACTGVIPSGHNTEFNVHIFWHETNGRVHIPAGTPLCQLVPIKTENPKFSFEKITDKIKNLNLRKIFATSHKFNYK